MEHDVRLEINFELIKGSNEVVVTGLGIGYQQIDESFLATIEEMSNDGVFWPYSSKIVKKNGDWFLVLFQGYTMKQIKIIETYILNSREVCEDEDKKNSSQNITEEKHEKSLYFTVKTWVLITLIAAEIFVGGYMFFFM